VLNRGKRQKYQKTKTIIGRIIKNNDGKRWSEKSWESRQVGGQSHSSQKKKIKVEKSSKKRNTGEKKKHLRSWE